MKCFHGRMGVCGLGSIICVLISTAKYKKIFTIIEWLENMGTLLYITPHSSAQPRHSYFLEEERSNTVSPFTEDKKMLNFDIH